MPGSVLRTEGTAVSQEALLCLVELTKYGKGKTQGTTGEQIRERPAAWAGEGFPEGVMDQWKLQRCEHVSGRKEE